MSSSSPGKRSIASGPKPVLDAHDKGVILDSPMASVPPLTTRTLVPIWDGRKGIPHDFDFKNVLNEVDYLDIPDNSAVIVYFTVSRYTQNRNGFEPVPTAVGFNIQEVVLIENGRGPVNVQKTYMLPDDFNGPGVSRKGYPNIDEVFGKVKEEMPAVGRQAKKSGSKQKSIQML